MPCSFCRHEGHNVRTCPSISHQRRIREQQALVPQTPPDSPPNSTPRSTGVDNAASSRERQQQYSVPRNIMIQITPRGISSNVLSAQTEAQRRAQRQQMEEQEQIDHDIDHSLHQIHSWARRLQREVGERRTLDLPPKKQIKLKMIENMDHHYNTENCPVCFDSYDNSSKSRLTSNCKHIVCCECITELMKRKKFECPCCRTSFNELHVLQGINMEAFNTISAVL